MDNGNAEQYAHPLVPVYSSELFRGTADYYSRFRPRYPAILINAIERTVGLGPDDALLDLACGTGEVTLAFADRVADIWAIDLEPEMVEAARRNAFDRGIARPRWLVGRAEEVGVPDGHFAMVAIGRAYHRLNRPLIAELSMRWLRSGGHFIDMGADTSGPFKASEPWLTAVGEVYERWLPQAAQAQSEVKSSSAPSQPKATSQAVLTQAGFEDVAKHEFPVPYVWEINQFIGYLRSTSYSSLQFWGEAREGFEFDLRKTLETFSSSGLLTETISAYFVVGRNP